MAASIASHSPRRKVSRVEMTASGADCAISKRQRLGGAAHLGLRHQQIGEPDPDGFVSGDAPAGVEHQRRLLRADDAGQGNRKSKARVEPEPVEICAEPRLLAGNPEVADQCEAQPPSDRRAMHRGNDRLSAAEQADSLLVEMLAGAAAAALGNGSGFHATREIGAGAERSSFGGEHDGPAARVGIEPLEGLAEFGDQFDAEEIVRRPAHLDGRDVAVLADIDIAH